MAFLNVGNVRLSGVAACVPARKEENRTLPVFASEEDASKFIATTGIERRRIADDRTTTADLCYNAAERLIENLWGGTERYRLPRFRYPNTGLLFARHFLYPAAAARTGRRVLHARYFARMLGLGIRHECPYQPSLKRPDAKRLAAMRRYGLEDELQPGQKFLASFW